MNFIKKFNDTRNLLSVLTARKTANGLKLLASYYISKITSRNFHSGMPVSIAIEPTTACNLRCPECPSGLRSFTRNTGMLNIDFFKKIIDEIHKDLLYLTFYFQGEPFLNPDFLEMVKYASEKGIYTATSTNAHYLNDVNAKKTVESGLKRLIISIDGTTQETYETYRIGGELDKVIEGTKNVLKWKKALNKKTPHVIFQFLIVKPNEHQMDDVKKLAVKLGVNQLKFKTAQIYDYKKGSELIPEKGNHSRYVINGDGNYHLKNSLLNHCWKMWHSCVITWDGNVVPCCFDKDATHQLGNLNGNVFKSIWKSPSYQKFRKTILGSRSEIDICKNCTEGTKVWV